jgi:hypothetical protein
VETLGPEATAPLLSELGRALRAWHFYENDAMRLETALSRAGRAWSLALRGGAAIEFEVSGDGRFWFGAEESLSGLGLEDVSRHLTGRGVHHLRADPGLVADEIPLLIRALASDSHASDGPEELERWLREHGSQHLWLTPPASAAEAVVLLDEIDPVTQFRANVTVDLVRALEALDAAQSVSDYNLAANRVEASVDRLLREAGPADAYRAVLALGRHASDPQARDAALFREGSDRLRRLMHRRDLLAYTLSQACETSGLSSVQATQILLLVADLAVPGLVERYSAGRADAQQAAMTLVALGERALGPLIDQLSHPDPMRARRAAKLLGDLQHPKAIPALAAALRTPDAALTHDVARALARIGNTNAVHALVDALTAGEATARPIVQSLSGSRHPIAVRALCDIASGAREFSEAIALDAIRALGFPGNGAAVATLASLLEHRSLLGRGRERPRRVAAALALGRIGGPAARKALEACARKGEAEVGDACGRALRELSRSGAASR